MRGVVRGTVRGAAHRGVHPMMRGASRSAPRVHHAMYPVVQLIEVRGWVARTKCGVAEAIAWLTWSWRGSSCSVKGACSSIGISKVAVRQ